MRYYYHFKGGKPLPPDEERILITLLVSIMVLFIGAIYIVTR